MKRRIATLLGFIILPYQNLFAQMDGRFFLSADNLRKYESLPITQNWKYHSGDDASWARPELDDHAWEIAATTLAPDNLPHTGWNGIGWFRLHLVMDSTLSLQTLGFRVWQAGAAEIYLDGKLLATNANRRPRAIALDGKTEHVIAVRYSNFATEKFHRAGYAAGFYFRLGHLNRMVENFSQELRVETAVQMIFTALPFAFGLVHLLLFLFFRRVTANLYYAILSFAGAALTFFDYQIVLATDVEQEFLYVWLHRLALALLLIFALRFIYAIFLAKRPGRFWIFTSALLVAGTLAIFRPMTLLGYIYILGAITFMEIARVIMKAIRNKQEGAWIIAWGFIVLLLFVSYDVLLDARILSPVHDIENAYFFGAFGLAAAMSIYLARDFARTNEKIIAQERLAKEREVQRRILEADNTRKTKELEEARQLQLSMLPQTVPQLPHLDIAVYMKPATEVGGDYYDFHRSEDGTLTVAIGDATGHGAKAGTMVATTKGLFGVLAKEADIQNIFVTFTKTIKSMNLGNLYMAMALVKIKDHRLIASSAGMPPLLIYRAATKQVEELELKGMPLGIFVEFPYKVEEVKLEAGDTILLMSDGLPERFNLDGEILDYPAAKNIFAEAAGKSPAEIISHLNQAGEKWANGRPQQDDVTFVVMKVKS